MTATLEKSSGASTSDERSWVNRETADTTEIETRDGGAELRLRTCRITRHMTGEKIRRKYSKVVRIRRDPDHPGMMHVHMTIFTNRAERGRGDYERSVPDAVLCSALKVDGYDIGFHTEWARSHPGATHGVDGLFVRDGEYLNLLGGWLKLLPRVSELMECFLKLERFCLY